MKKSIAESLLNNLLTFVVLALIGISTALITVYSSQYLTKEAYARDQKEQVRILTEMQSDLKYVKENIKQHLDKGH